MPNHDIVVVGGSAGAIPALQTLIRGLSPDSKATFFVVVHTAPWQESGLHKVLAQDAAIPVNRATHGFKFRRGEVYVAVPDRHLLLDKQRILLVRGPKENRSRPAIDPLFRSAALNFGPRVIGVLLSGLLEDGTSGLWHIKHAGGYVVVQNPDDAQHSAMPLSALNNVTVDHCLPVSEMPRQLARLIGTSVSRKTKRIPEFMRVEERIVKMEDGIHDIRKIGKPSQYTCPECSGTLYELSDEQQLRYRCRTGHGFGQLSLMAEQRTFVEDALWTAMRALREKSELLFQRAESKSENDSSRKKLKRLARWSSQQANHLRNMIETIEGQDQPDYHSSSPLL